MHLKYKFILCYGRVSRQTFQQNHPINLYLNFIHCEDLMGDVSDHIFDINHKNVSVG